MIETNADERDALCPIKNRLQNWEGELRVKIYQWGELPACLLRRIRKLEAYATAKTW